MDNKNTKKILIFNSVLLLLIISFAFFGVFYIKKQIKEIVEIREKIKIETAKNYSIVDIKKDTATLKDIEAKIDDIYIKRDQVVLFIEKLENIAKDLNVELEIKNIGNVDEKNSKAGGKYGELPISLQIEGKWEQVTNFLIMVENIPNHISINSVKINSSEKSNWNMSLMLKVLTN